MRVRIRVATLLALLCLPIITACVGSAGPPVFTGRNNASALLVQWLDDGNGALSGSVQVAEKAAGLDGEPVKQATLTFNGTIDSGQVALAMSQGQGQPKTWNGTLDGDQLRLDVPQGGRGVETIVLERSSVAAFNTQVVILEAAVTKARMEAAQAIAAQQSQAATRTAEATSQRALVEAVREASAAQEAVSALLSDPPELRALPAEVRGAGKHLATMLENVAEAAQRSRGFVACEYATQARTASDNVKSVASSLADDVRAVIGAADDLAAARLDFSRASATVQRLSARGGHSGKSGSPSREAMFDQARQTALRWRASATKANTQMKAIVAQANQLAGNAVNASC